MGIKILHLADLHIGANESFLGEKASGRRIEALLTFERAVDIAKEEGVELFLIAGDLLDSNKIENSFISRITDKISSVPEIKFVISFGNHDPLNSESPFLKIKTPKNLIIMPTVDSVFEIKEGVKVYGRSFSETLESGSDRFSIEADGETVNIMCIHGCFGISGEHNPISDNFVITSGMDYIALGHIHKRTTPRKLGNTYIAYCGCTEGLGFDELGEKGVYIGEIDKNTCELQFFPIYKRMHIAEKTDVSGAKDETEIFRKTVSLLREKYGENFGENLYKIVLTGEIEEDIQIDKNEIAERLKEITYFAKVYDETTIKFDPQKIKNEESLKGVFVKNMLLKAEQDPENRVIYERALKIGLKAFSGEVNFDEDQ
ncbi:MAG: DNA repair exonuclease [Clostridia bacterium]|nr:DNA repair exonuclease [Clostridia bacterium]